MAKLSFPIAAAVVGGLAVGGALLLGTLDAPDPVSPAPSSANGTDGADVRNAGASNDAVTGTDQAPALRPPSFDVVRIDRDGSTVLAGRAAPGATVGIRRDNTEIGTVIADDRGEWVFVPTEPLEPGSAVLSLAMTPDGDDVVVPSQEDVVVIVPTPEDATVEADPNVAAAVAAVGGEPETTVDPTPAQPMALKIGRDGATQLLQHPEPAQTTSDGAMALSIDTVDYDDAGRISIGGRAPEGTTIVLYVDNGLVGRADTENGTVWRVTPEIEIAPGVHTVRADWVDPDGRVLARVMIPFARQAFDEPLEDGDFVVVQPGNSLWRLARRSYGSGYAYTVIYRANAEQIRDPDLIFPGQIFKLPATN